MASTPNAWHVALRPPVRRALKLRRIVAKLELLE
jgi:hypothetical protein